MKFLPFDFLFAETAHKKTRLAKPPARVGKEVQKLKSTFLKQ